MAPDSATKLRSHNYLPPISGPECRRCGQVCGSTGACAYVVGYANGPVQHQGPTSRTGFRVPLEPEVSLVRSRVGWHGGIAPPGSGIGPGGHFLIYAEFGIAWKHARRVRRAARGNGPIATQAPPPGRLNQDSRGGVARRTQKVAMQK